MLPDYLILEVTHLVSVDLEVRLLITIGVILQILNSCIFIYFGVSLLFFTLLGSSFIISDEPPNPLGTVTIFSMFTSAIAGFIFSILWLVWLIRPKTHQKAFFVTGLLALTVTGIIPLILANLLGVPAILAWHSWMMYWHLTSVTSVLPGLLLLIASRVILAVK